MNNPFPDSVTTIGIAAPSSAADRGQYEASLELLRSSGIRTVEGGHLFTPSDAPPYLSAPDDARADDLNDLIRNPEIDLILCLRGGYGSMRILDRIDWKTLRERNLPVIGFSDVTALHLAMFARKAGLPIAGQMAAALFITRTTAFLYYLPVLMVSAIGTGIFTGLCAQLVSWRARRAGFLSR